MGTSTEGSKFGQVIYSIQNFQGLYLVHASSGYSLVSTELLYTLVYSTTIRRGFQLRTLEILVEIRGKTRVSFFFCLLMFSPGSMIEALIIHRWSQGTVAR